MSTSSGTTERGRRRPRRSVRSTTLRSTAVALAAALAISIGLAAQMARGQDPALGHRSSPAAAKHQPASGIQPAPAPPLVTRSS